MTIGARRAAGLVMLVVIATTAPASCSSSAPEVLPTAGQPCGQDVSTDAIKGTVERVGGLRTDDYTVTFAQGTSAGVVVLVEGDAHQALDDLDHLPGLGIVAEVDDVEDPGPINGFTQVQRIVDDTCGA